jgi:hypothetical protein
MNTSILHKIWRIFLLCLLPVLVIACTTSQPIAPEPTSPPATPEPTPTAVAITPTATQAPTALPTATATAVPTPEAQLPEWPRLDNGRVDDPTFPEELQGRVTRIELITENDRDRWVAFGLDDDGHEIEYAEYVIGEDGEEREWDLLVEGDQGEDQESVVEIPEVVSLLANMENISPSQVLYIPDGYEANGKTIGYGLPPEIASKILQPAEYLALLQQNGIDIELFSNPAPDTYQGIGHYTFIFELHAVFLGSREVDLPNVGMRSAGIFQTFGIDTTGQVVPIVFEKRTKDADCRVESPNQTVIFYTGDKQKCDVDFIETTTANNRLVTLSYHKDVGDRAHQRTGALAFTNLTSPFGEGIDPNFLKNEALGAKMGAALLMEIKLRR